MNILDKIVAEKHREVELLKSSPSAASSCSSMALSPRRPFIEALRRGASPIALIAEVKKASPSAGVIRPDFDPVRIALEYEAAGASCLSVLTDEPFFQGSLRYLESIRQAVQLPLLRKDFIIDPCQIPQSLEWGADAILLIAAILTDEQLADLHQRADAAGLAVLVEVHDETELRRVLNIGARLIGINNRNLKTFRVDLATTERLSRLIQTEYPGREPFLVAESGVHTREDVERLIQCGAQAMLVGEALMRQGDIAAQARRLLNSR